MKKIFSLLLAFASALIMSISAAAFDANDYDYGGGSDWGGSSDWGSSDWGDDDYFYSGSTGSSDGSGGGGIGVGTIIVVIIILVVIMKNSKSRNNSNGGGNPPTTGMGGGVRPANGGQGMNVNVPDRTAQIEDIIRANDPNFTADDFTSFAKNVYIDIQNAWCARDLSTVRPVMHTNLYNTTDKQIQSKIQQKVIYHYESIAINTAYLTSYVQDRQFEYLTVYLNARFIDYQTNEETGQIIRGDKNTRWDFRYKMKFMRSIGVLTKDATADNGGGTGHNCPNCGAPIEISSSGKCPYCDSVVTTGLYSWVLSDFTTVRNDTKDDGIRVNNGENAAKPSVNPDDYEGKYFLYADTMSVVDVNLKAVGFASNTSQDIVDANGNVVGNQSDIVGYMDMNRGLVTADGKVVRTVQQLHEAFKSDCVLELISYPTSAKLRIIEMIREITHCGLKDAKMIAEREGVKSIPLTNEQATKYSAELDALNAQYRIRKS